MTKEIVLSGPSFNKLVVDLRKIIDTGRARAEPTNREVMMTYWRAGERLARATPDGKLRLWRVHHGTPGHRTARRPDDVGPVCSLSPILP